MTSRGSSVATDCHDEPESVLPDGTHPSEVFRYRRLLRTL